MQFAETQRSVEQVVAAIQALDLEAIKVKLMDTEEGQGWSREYAEQMELAYKRFLTLSVKYPDEIVAPSKDVDKFWHGHILDTMKYARDCDAVFGYFLHHFPYFGMRGAEDAANLITAGRRTQQLYEREFGPDNRASDGAAAMCAASKPTESTAMCAAARPIETAAMCAAARPIESVAMCASAKPIGSVAMCAAARPIETAAMCAAANRADAAMCAAAGPVAAERLMVNVRPSLAAAA